MTVTATSFRDIFTEFKSTNVYSDSAITFWITQATNQLDGFRFGSSLDLATMLFVAHNLVLGARDAAAAQSGGISGQASGPISSKSVDKVSVSYDAGLGSIEGASSYNLTSYGQRLYKMMQQFCTGPVYVSPRRPLVFRR